MPVTIWKSIEVRNVTNAEIAASASEASITAPVNVDAYNMLFVQNNDANSNIEVRLNDPRGNGEVFRVAKNLGFINLGPDLPIWFRSVTITNLNAAAVVAAGAVTIRASKAVPRVIRAIGEGDVTPGMSGATEQFGFGSG